MEKYYKQEIKAGEEYKLGESFETKEGVKKQDIWVIPQGGGICASPLIFKNVLLFGSYDTYFYALDKATGELIWKFKTGDIIVNSPMIADGNVIFGSFDSHVYCVDANNGTLQWKFKTGGRIAGSAALYRGRLFVGSKNGILYALSPSGETQWQFNSGSPIDSTPAFVSGKSYFGNDDGNFFCLDMEGKVLWKFYAGKWIANSACVFAEDSVWDFSGGKDYEGPASVCFGSYNRNFYVLNAESGAMQWMRRLDGIINWSHPVVRRGKIYFGDWSGHLYCLDADSGSMDWKVLTGGNVDTQPVIYGNYLYFGSYDGNLYALSLEGKISWKYQTGGIIFSSPVISNNILYFGSMDSNFYAIDINTRKVVWKFVTGGGVPAPIKWIPIVEKIKESQRIFSAWKPELIKPAYKEDKALTFVAAPEHAYAQQKPYKGLAPYEAEQKKKKMPWEK